MVVGDGGGAIGAVTGHRTVDADDTRTAGRQQQGVLPAETAARTADHRDLSVEVQLVGRGHHVTGSSFMP